MHAVGFCSYFIFSPAGAEKTLRVNKNSKVSGQKNKTKELKDAKTVRQLVDATPGKENQYVLIRIRLYSENVMF